MSILKSIFFGGCFIVFPSVFCQNFSIDDMRNPSLFPKRQKMSDFTSDGKLLITEKTDTKSKSWWAITANPANKSDSLSTLFHSDWFPQKPEKGDLVFSKNNQFLLISTQPQSIYRHSVSVEATVVNIPQKKTYKIPGRVQYATLSPDNKNLAYVRDNNLYIYQLETEKEIAVTSDGKKNEIINGGVDWVYEEEFSMSQGFEWSPNGNSIAYYKFDESKVPEFSMDVFTDLYPRQERWKYPKAGENNSVVNVYVYSLNGNNIKLELGSENDQYIPRFKWSLSDEFLSIQRLNRLQNHWEILFYNTLKKSLQTIVEEKDSAYVEITDNLLFIPNCPEFIYTSEKSGFNHIYLKNYLNGSERMVTTGKWQVNSIVGYNPEANKLYFTSTELSTVEDRLYAIALSGKDKTMVIPSLKGEGNQTVIASPNCHWMYISQTNFSDTPTYHFYLVGKQYRSHFQDTQFTKNLQSRNPGMVEFNEMSISNGNESPVVLNYWMLKPANFDPNKKYPLLMYVYGGPGNSICRNSFQGYYAWFQHLASRGYIVACVDNRGTGNKGAQFKKCTYLKLGELEHLDQHNAALYFGKLPFIDANRIGTWGWSFGGYMSSLCITKSADVFKMAIAVAPVTHWKYYDNIYTERYLRTPQLNKSGYENNSPINYVDNIKGKFLIVHGTGDDNVHFQNTVEMVNAMIRKNKPFNSEFYPNRAHGIGDMQARTHLFQLLTNYIEDNL